MKNLQQFLYSLTISLFGFCVYAQPSILQNPPVSEIKSDDISENYILGETDKAAISENTIEKDTIDNSATDQQKDIQTYPPTERDYKRLGLDTGMYFGAAALGFAVLWSVPGTVSGWDKEEMKENGITEKWKQNVKAGPAWDDDDWFINYVSHPYSGAIYFMTARSSGFTFLESFAYSALMSTFFWEYGIEAFAEIPSIQDLIITPVVGSAIGEGFFYAKKSIMKSDKKILRSKALGVTALVVIDPFNTLLDAFGYENKAARPQMNISPVGYDYKSNKTIWGFNLTAQF